MNVLYGLYQADEGEIYVGGKKTDIKNPNVAIANGIGMVHQHFMLVEDFTVTQNIILGNETTSHAGVVDMKRARKQILEIVEKYGLEVDPDAKVNDISVGMQQRVEILKALYRGAELLILDEPITGLDPSAILDFYQLIRKLNQEEKVAILMVSHDMANIVHQGGKILQMRQKPLFWGTMKEYVKSEIAHSFLGREELATLGHRCGVPMQKDGIRKMQKPETDSETKQHLKDRNAEKEV